METKLILNKKSSGNYDVTVTRFAHEIGTFNTNDMQLIDDISEMNNHGNEDNLFVFESFDDLIEHCLIQVPVYLIVDDSNDKYVFLDGGTTEDTDNVEWFKTEEDAKEAIKEYNMDKWASAVKTVL